jgi:hypothetical protein
MLVGATEQWKDTKNAAKESLEQINVHTDIRGRVKDPYEARQAAAAALRIARNDFLGSSDEESDEEPKNPNYDRNGLFKWGEAQGVAVASAQAKYQASLRTNLFQDLLAYVMARHQKEWGMRVWASAALGFAPIADARNPAKTGIMLDRRQWRAENLAKVTQKRLPPENKFMKQINESPFALGLGLRKVAVVEDGRGEPADLSEATADDLVKDALVWADWGSDYTRAEPPMDFEEARVQRPSKKKRDKRGELNFWILKFPDGKTIQKHISEIKIKREPAGVRALKQAFLETQQRRERELEERVQMAVLEAEGHAFLKKLVMVQIEKDEESRRKVRPRTTRRLSTH